MPPAAQDVHPDYLVGKELAARFMAEETATGYWPSDEYRHELDWYERCGERP